jgi:Tfp pilus assembly protein PilF
VIIHQPLRYVLAILLFSIALSACSSSSHRPPLDSSKLERLAHIHYQLGIDALGKTGMLPKAFDELMESDSILPNQPYVLDALAYAWLLRGDLNKSEASYRKALKYGDAASIHNNYANLLNRLKRFNEAEQSARKALDDPRYPNQDLAFINLGNALLGQLKFPEAKRAFQQAKLFNPNNRMADLRLADTYFQQNKPRESRLLYEMLIRQQPNNRSAVEGLLAVLKKQHNTRQSQIVLQQFSQHAASAENKAWALDRLNNIKPSNHSSGQNHP